MLPFLSPQHRGPSGHETVTFELGLLRLPLFFCPFFVFLFLHRLYFFPLSACCRPLLLCHILLLPSINMTVYHLLLPFIRILNRTKWKTNSSRASLISTPTSPRGTTVKTIAVSLYFTFNQFVFKPLSPETTWSFESKILLDLQKKRNYCILALRVLGKPLS